MAQYRPDLIEPKWQKFWSKQDLYQAKDFSRKPKFYCLVEFPYPSGERLHVGHARSYVALDVISRMKRMQGCNVLFPIGWDAFGLPAENYAIKTGIHPSLTTKKNIKNAKKQIISWGVSFDWSREINTTDPSYYKWTQWIFLKLYKAGLAYKAKMPINWCPRCKIGLANEEVIVGRCERCGAQTERREIEQWMLKITAYADRLIKDLDKVDYLPKIKTQQINWIGRSEGTLIKFPILNSKLQIEVFTTRADTLFGVTYLVLAPEHKLVGALKAQIQNWSQVEKYIQNSLKKSELERTSLEKKRTGIQLQGIKAQNPLNGQEIPVWVADYVVPSYGRGAIMAVPAHDKRDYDFAKKYKLPIIEVIKPKGGRKFRGVFVDYGVMFNSGKYNGLTSEEGIKEITRDLAKKKLAQKAVNYKLRDWVFSRQHYWGEPIPIVYCQSCWERKIQKPKAKMKKGIDYIVKEGKGYAIVPVPEKDLPVTLPMVKRYKPTGTGESPLVAVKDWVKVKCPQCGGLAQRETDTMPNWAGSSWYFIRYIDPENQKALADKKKMKYWLPVDLYNGGMEHTTLHLLYSRFWYKALYDMGVVPNEEPYACRRSHGVILGPDGQKMSKSRGNVINPDDIVRKYGADTFRLYELFIGPFDEKARWSISGIEGVFRFVKRVWQLFQKPIEDKKPTQEQLSLIHRAIKEVTSKLLDFKFNTAVSAFMVLVNQLSKQPKQNKEILKLFIKIFAPFAPHLGEELWRRLGGKESVFREKWPSWDEKLAKQESFVLIVQIDGKLRDKIEAPLSLTEDEAKRKALSSPKIQRFIKGRKIKKIVYVKERLLSIATE